MNITVFIQPTAAEVAATHDAAIAEQLNSVLRRCGLHLATAATQLHVVPEAVYAVSDKVAALLSRHAQILVSHEDVHCDFSALSGVLWDRVKKAEDQLDAFLQGAQGRFADRCHVSSASPLLKHLVALGQDLRTLRHADEPFARPEVHEAVPVVQKDIEMAVRISIKVLRILEGAVANFKDVDLRFTRGAQFSLANAELYLATCAARPTVDVAPLLSFIYTESTWRLSGMSAYATESYCESVRRLVRALFARQEEFLGVEAKAAELLLHRLAARPPFSEDTFCALHSNRDEPATAEYGLLRVMSSVLLRVEDVLLAEQPWAPSLRRECARLLREMNGRKQLLSYFQVPVLAVLRGMPAVDLTDDAQLLSRAAETCLCAGPCAAAGRPGLLRVLLAHGFAAGVSGAARHGALSRRSAAALARDVAAELLQLPRLRGAAAPLDALRLRLPVLSARLARLVTDAAVACGAAAEALAEVHDASAAVFAASVAQCAARLSAERVEPQTRRFATAAAELLAHFVNAGAFLEAAKSPRVALELAARIYALHAFYSAASDSDSSSSSSSPSASSSTGLSAEKWQRRIAALAGRLATLAQEMPRAELSAAFAALLLPCASAEFMARRNRQEYALLEAYVRAFATAGAALAIEEPMILRHWVDIALRCAKNAVSGALAVSGVDLLAAAFHSRRPIAPLFVPTYVSLLVPIANKPRYGEPPLFLVRHFAKGVRAVCVALEECDAEALSHALADPASPVAKFVAQAADGGAAVPLDNVQPIRSVLLIVSALFDKISALLMGYSGSGVPRKERQVRFQVYFSGLINLLRCRVSAVLHRVCASIEAVMLEHLQDVPTAQAQWMKYIGLTVDDVSGNSKNCVAEWFLTLSERMSVNVGRSHL